MSSPTMKPSLAANSVDVHPPQSPYPLRLPSYRSSYLERYHPYGRKPSHRKIDLMKTIDLRHDGIGSRASLSLSVVEEEEEADDDGDDRDDLDGYITEVAPGEILEEAAAGSPPGKALILRRRSFTTMIVALAFAMRRSLQSMKLRS